MARSPTTPQEPAGWKTMTSEESTAGAETGETPPRRPPRPSGTWLRQADSTTRQETADLSQGMAIYQQDCRVSEAGDRVAELRASLQIEEDTQAAGRNQLNRSPG
ncbi:hypothetical protein NDU88_001426 [Pleurodeles waltl]|uniref:Uncharacterized protein n=1 Tax=Pleurodeles waltl TaxID=8319 RepID=A0AAV7MJP5_PLEWA|nr:hypothetical protein NDU88_001426 [Pleurodeles waltl]